MERIAQFVELQISNLKETLYFYEGILGFRPSKHRPELHVPGVWYDVGHTRICCVVHKKEKTMEIEVNLPLHELESVQKKLDYYNVAYTESGHERNSEKGLSVYDPDSHRVHIQAEISI